MHKICYSKVFISKLNLCTKCKGHSVGPYLLKRIAFHHHRPSTYCYIKANQAPALCSCQKDVERHFNFLLFVFFSLIQSYIILDVISVSSTKSFMIGIFCIFMSTQRTILRNIFMSLHV